MHGTLDVLLVEDNEGDVIAVQRAFRNGTPACNISVVNDGVEALDFLHKRESYGNVTMPQLILIDVNMPRMGGKEFLEIIKAEKKFRAIPVVMLTSSQSLADIRECYERHVNCYVVKPFDGKEFESTVKQIVNFWGTLGQLP